MDEWRRRLWAVEVGEGGEAERAAADRVASALLAPAEWAYAAASAARGWAFEHGLLPSRSGTLPTLVVGNLTVGGTGKTPVAAWFAAELRARGRRPAVVMRGYGGDEVDVHRRLNPNVPVLVAADRLAGVDQARSAGADVAVLDDAFQHRAIRPTASVVLVAAEEWTERPRRLPRGPWREPLSALRRASLLVVTRRTSAPERAEEVGARITELGLEVERAQAHIRLAGLARYEERIGLGPVQTAEGFRSPLAIAGVARPEAVRLQLSAAGSKVAETCAFPDHHRYSDADLAFIRRRSDGGPLIATLKDAVKIAAALGDELEIYVPIQEIIWERGRTLVDGLIDRFVERAAPSGR